ncbi:hypothetical protein [Streptomyces sp. NPDC005408]|uniref:hypothetical protein n=1 Tax=Streptomyces sp. NPDC005408 TaxID=3155341 RepID=UPI0033AE7CA4
MTDRQGLQAEREGRGDMECVDGPGRERERGERVADERVGCPGVFPAVQPKEQSCVVLGAECAGDDSGDGSRRIYGHLGRRRFLAGDDTLTVEARVAMDLSSSNAVMRSGPADVVRHTLVNVVVQIPPVMPMAICRSSR